MYIKVNNTGIFYVKQGSGQPIILIHGNGESHKIFERTIDDLSKSYTVYALDMRGQGQSDKVDELHYEDMADDVYNFIVANKIKNPYYFGFSDGGIVGLIVGYKYPDALKKMLLAGANTNPNTIKKSWDLLFKIWYFFSRDNIVKVTMVEPHITAEQLRQITTPTVVMMGQKDLIKKSDGEFINSNIQHSKFVELKGEGHSSYVTNNDKLTPLLQEYLLDD